MKRIISIALLATLLCGVAMAAGDRATLRQALGLEPNIEVVHKFGEALNCDNGAPTDLWDGADTGGTGTIIWVAPTAARVHALVSTDTADDGEGTPQTGMRTVRVYGLTSWSTAETYEDVTLDGTTPVNTTNSYVIIHRMVGLTFGSGGTNAGIITATAATDSTVTAAIQAGMGQSKMAIYAVPSGEYALLTYVRLTALKSTGATPYVDAELEVKLNADQADSGFVVKDVYSFSGANGMIDPYDPPLMYAGPCIIKLQVTSNTDNTQVSGRITLVKASSLDI